MDRFSVWLYVRYRESFGWAVVVVAYVAATVAIVIPATVAAAVWMGRSPLLDLMAAPAVGGIAVLAAGWTSRGNIDLIHGWTRGEHTDALDVWRAVHRLPLQLPARVLVFIMPFGALVYVPLSVRWSGQEGISAHLVVGLLAAATGFAAASLVAVGLTMLLRPLAVEVATRLPLLLARRRYGLAVRSRILLGAAIAALSTGLFTAVAVVQVESLTAQMWVSLAVGISSAIFLVVVFDLAYVSTISTPLRALSEATERVARGVFDEPAPVGWADELGELATSFNEMQDGLAERERLHAAFGSYVDPELATRLLAQGDDLFAGESVNVTVLFADIRDFTPYAERHDAQVVVARLNALFEVVLPVLTDRHGHANKFLGDGLMAVFGVPELIGDHADQAVISAVEIQRRVRAHFGEDLRIGIGINTGDVIAGTIGGPGKLEFTLIGNTVNVAARVEQATKATGDPILITQTTLDALTAPPVNLEPRGAHELKGKTERVQLHALDPFSETAAGEQPSGGPAVN